jgi:tRNA A-37 threonylcarbamoyl transferase component Bud32
MQSLSLSEYNDLVEGAETLTSEFVDGRIWPKVLRLEDQSILKLFRLKRFITSARLIPYVTRFQRHVKRLEAVDIPTVRINVVYNITAINRTAVHYWPLEGETLREHCETRPIDIHQAKRLGQFFLFLHQNGIYFRSIHFGNIVLTADDRIGLIDVVDMRFRRRPLNMTLRIRNLRHLFRYDADIDCLAPVRHIFIDAYCKSSRLRSSYEGRLRHHFESYFQNRTGHLDRSA